MITCAQFKKNVEHGGLMGRLKSTGRIIYVIAAFEAYEQSYKMNEPAIRQMSYFYELYKQCKKWLEEKKNVTSDKGQSRWMHVSTLKHQILEEMPARYPQFFSALNAYEERKATGVAGPTMTPRGVYAHEVANYRSQKVARMDWTPATPRYTASPSLMRDVVDPTFDKLKGTGSQYHKGFAKTSIFPVRNKIKFDDMSLAQFRELDMVLKGQFNVLYLTKIQRLQYMVMIEDGLMKRPDGARITLSPGKSVRVELNKSAYVIDKYGNLFATTEDDHTMNVNQRINHTTLCAGNDVLCAGQMSIKDGKLQMITNGSGHYKATTAFLREAVRMLADSGIDMRTVLVSDASQNSKTYAALDFLNGLDREVSEKIETAFTARTI